MCLTPRKDSDKPYDESKIRYKVMEVVEDRIASLFVDQAWKINEWYIAEDRSLCGRVIPDGPGFHVFITEEDAEKYRENYKGFRSKYFQIVRVEVGEFIASGYYVMDIGTFATETFETEKWNRARILEVIGV